MKVIQNIITLIISILLIISCGVTKPTVPVETIYNYKDSTIVHVDSVEIEIPVERYVDVVNELDTLKMESSVAISISYLDKDTKTLKGTLENKKGNLKKEIVYKDRIIEKEVYKDKPIYVEVEKKVKVHPFYESILWLLSGLFLLSILYKYIKNKYGFFRRE